MAGFRALRVDKGGDDIQRVELTELQDDDLAEGDVTVAVEYSTVNYKDGMALTGGPIVRRFPLVPGIDLAGTVESGDGAFAPGDRVVLNGWGVGETHDGGYAQRARVKSEWLVALPDAISTQQAMAIGTAGYTAMLAVLALEDGGVGADDGDVLVTGAAGGVGSVAIAVLAQLGYRVVASSGRAGEEGEYLTGLGAAEVIDRGELSEPGKPLGKERWAGAVDAVGSHTLANVLAQIQRGGVVAACGLAQGNDLPTTVLPFLMRGVTLAGIDSVYAPQARREQAWQRLAHDLDMDKLDQMTSVVGLDDVVGVAERILAGQVRGRTVVDVHA